MQKKLGYNTNETFLVFIDLLTFLNSIRSFPDASWALENQVNADVGTFVLLFVSFLWRLKLLEYILKSRICDWVP